MDLPTVLGAPRHCYLNGSVYWVRPMTMLDLAIVMQWLDDVLPGRADRRMPPKIGDEASRSALGSFPGQTLLAWLALREHGFSYAQAAEPMPHPDDGESEWASKKAIEHFRLMEVFMSRRRTREPSEGGEDVSETWCGEAMAALASEYGISEVGRLTLDQYEWLGSSGKADELTRFDLQAAIDDLPRRVAAFEAAMKAGLVSEVLPSTQ